jgi:hypothetical protein
MDMTYLQMLLKSGYNLSVVEGSWDGNTINQWREEARKDV